MNRLISRTISLAALAAAASAPPAMAQQVQNYQIDLAELNDSGVTGKVQIKYSEGRFLRIIINAKGLEPGGVHLGHIHGRVMNGMAVDSQCPTMAADTDGDGFIELGEGVPLYGDVLIPLGNIDPDGDGKVTYNRNVDLQDSRFFAAGANASVVTPLDFRAIVLHGLTVPSGPGEGTDGEVNGENGYLTALPVACGDITAVGGGKR